MLVDARDLDPAEREELAASRVRQVPADPGAIEAALRGLEDQPVYLHLDVDIIDGAELPGIRYPVSPGPSLGLIEDCLAAIMASRQCGRGLHRVHLGSRPPQPGPVITRLARVLGARLAW